MNNEKLKNNISSVLEEFSKLLIDHEENKQQQIKLKTLVDILREELNVARVSEHNADIKRSKSLEYVVQQQEVIVKLLHIKEENEQLNQTITLMEQRLVEIQMNRSVEQEKKDEEINNIKQEYLRELIKVQEDGDLQVKKLEQEIDLEIQGLKSSVGVEKKKMVLQSNTISSLQDEINSLKEKSVKDLEAYHNKLAEQEKVFQAELETWKVAKSSYDRNDIDLARGSIPAREISRARPLHPVRKNTFSEIHDGDEAYSGVSHKPEGNSYYRYQQLQNDLTHHYSENLNNCPEAENISSVLLWRESTKNADDKYQFQKPTGPQTYTDGIHKVKNNNLDATFVDNSDHQTAQISVNPRNPNINSVPQLSSISNNYKLPSQPHTYPKLPILSKNRRPKSGSRVVRPLPKPKEVNHENAGFCKAGDLYMQESKDVGNDSPDEPLARKEADDCGQVEKSSEKQKPKAMVPAKRRKLFTAELNTLL